MAKIVYVDSEGTSNSVEVAAGTSLMEGARANGISGILAECGGACSCATCHVYVAPEWVQALPEKEPIEEEMLEFAWNPDPIRSRLACQVKVTSELDGLIVHLPERQV